MKKRMTVWRALMVVSVALCAVACGGSDSPEKCIEECWKSLSKGDTAAAVAMMKTSPEEVELYRSIFAEQSGELQRAGGFDQLEIVGSDVSAESATIDAVVVLKDGQRIEGSYRLVKENDRWLITE